MVPIKLIGMGNEFRQDDAVGLLIVRKLRPLIPAEIQTLELANSGLDLITAWQDAETVYLFDAIRSSAEVGTLYRLDAHRQPLPTQLLNCSTHALRLAEVIELARAINQLPSKLMIYGIEGKNFGTGIGISPQVEAAAEQLVKQVLSDFRAEIH